MSLLGQRKTKNGSRANADNSLSDNGNLPTVDVPEEETETWREETGRSTNFWEGAADVVPDLVNLGGNIFGGGGEKGSGQTERDTLAHAIDKLEAYNDFEALEVAPLAVEAYVTQGTKRAAAEVIESEYGKGDPEGLMNSHKWAYIDRMLDKEAAQQNQSSPQQASMLPAMSVSGGQSPAGRYGLLAGAILAAGALGYIGYQEFIA